MNLYEKECKGCGTKFMGNDATLYCEGCRKIRYGYVTEKGVGTTVVCLDCGTEFLRTSPAQKYCDHCSEIHRKQNIKKSRYNYNKKAYDRMEFRVPKGEKAVIVAHAKKQGESINQFFKRAIDNQIESDNNT